MWRIVDNFLHHPYFFWVNLEENVHDFLIFRSAAFPIYSFCIVSLYVQLNTAALLVILFVRTDKAEILLCLILNIEYIYICMKLNKQDKPFPKHFKNRLNVKTFRHSPAIFPACEQFKNGMCSIWNDIYIRKVVT